MPVKPLQASAFSGTSAGQALSPMHHHDELMQLQLTPEG
jgi:hypothetical protein